jgi:hypothetical protein
VSTRTKPPVKGAKSAKRAKSAQRSAKDPQLHHLHVVVDDELDEGIKAHACKLEGRPTNGKYEGSLNLSASVRDLLRRALGLTPSAA